MAFNEVTEDMSERKVRRDDRYPVPIVKSVTIRLRQTAQWAMHANPDDLYYTVTREYVSAEVQSYQAVKHLLETA